jgi:hypothetical protein
VKRVPQLVPPGEHTVESIGGCAPLAGEQYWIVVELPAGQPNVPRSEYYLTWRITAAEVGALPLPLAPREVRVYYVVQIPDAVAAVDQGSDVVLTPGVAIGQRHIVSASPPAEWSDPARSHGSIGGRFRAEPCVRATRP